MGSSACVVIACLTAFLAFGALLSSTVTNRWYCVGGTCNSLDYQFLSDTLAPVCNQTRTPGKIRSRMVASQALLISACVFSFVGLLIIVGAKFSTGAGLWLVGMLLLLLCSLTAGAGLGLYVFTLNNWLFCGQTYCEYFTNLAVCVNSFGYSSVLSGLGFILGFIAIVSAGCGYAQTKAAQDLDEEENDASEFTDVAPPPREQDSKQSKNSGSQQKQSQSQPQQQTSSNHEANHSPANDEESAPGEAVSPAKKTEKDRPEGDWVLDEESGMYWSDAERLYLDRDTEQYYDPESEQWYDPVSGEWYVHKD